MNAQHTLLKFAAAVVVLAAVGESQASAQVLGNLRPGIRQMLRPQRNNAPAAQQNRPTTNRSGLASSLAAKGRAAETGAPVPQPGAYDPNFFQGQAGANAAAGAVPAPPEAGAA